MSLSSFFKSFSTRNKVFYNLFEEMVENLISMNQLFQQVIAENDIDARAALTKQIKAYEHKNDNLSHQVFIELGKNFITPFDREDVHSLTSALDDVSDYIDVTAKKIIMFKIKTLGSEIGKLAGINEKAILSLKAAVYGLRDLKQITQINEACIAINGFENQADDVFETALTQLLDNATDPIAVIKMKEILQSLEIVSDKCEDAADVISSILVKYA